MVYLENFMKKQENRMHSRLFHNSWFIPDNVEFEQITLMIVTSNIAKNQKVSW